MRLRVTSVDEYQFLTCVKHQVWGSKSARFGTWQQGDYLVILVNKAVAGLAVVSSKSYTSKQRIWDNGVFPHRIDIQFSHAFFPDNRLPVLGKIRDVLTSTWGTRYGLGILNQQLLQDEAADIITNTIKSRTNNLPEMESQIDELLTEAKLQRDSPKRVKRKKAEPSKEVEVVAQVEDVPRSKKEESAHLKAQHELIRLGRATGCSVWVASNDKNKKYKGNSLGALCLKALPNLGLSTEATKRISLIDVIWIKQNGPVCAFEVEETTSVYSGLLRMSDMISVVPALNIKLFIVAPKERENKVMAELARPTFQKIGLSDYCRFIATEDLEKLTTKVEDLVENIAGIVTPNIVDTIAIELEQEAESSLQ
jgi:hypothetical protein